MREIFGQINLWSVLNFILDLVDEMMMEDVL